MTSAIAGVTDCICTAPAFIANVGNLNDDEDDADVVVVDDDDDDDDDDVGPVTSATSIEHLFPTPDINE